jgi:hypothetical protein
MALPSAFPLQEFMGQLQEYCEQPIKEADGLTCRLRKATYEDPETFREFLNFIREHRTQFPNYNVEFNIKNLTVDLGEAFFHANRLAEFFKKPIAQKDVLESMKYLLELGWTEENFASLGVSHTSFFRYQKRVQAVPSKLPEET